MSGEQHERGRQERRVRSRGRLDGQLKGADEKKQTATHQMRILQFFDDLDVVELDVEVLVDGLEGAADGNVVLQLYSDLMVDERLEKAARASAELREMQI